MDLNNRFSRIIQMCQKAKKKYGFDYEEKYKNKIEKFSKEIKENKLIDKCEDKTFAKQLCIMNDINYN